MRPQRTLPAMAAIAVLLFTLTACGGNSPAEAPGESSAGQSSVPVQTEAVPIASSVLKPSPSAAGEAQLIQGSGIYVGQIDNHSVEIETEEGPTAFELGTGVEDAPELLEMDDPVVFAYVEKVVGTDPVVIQRILSSLAKADSEETPPSQAGVLPDTRTFKLTLEGMEEEKTAALAAGDGFSLYVFDIFTFDAASGRLAMKVDPGYYAEITKLPPDYNLDRLEQESRAELASTGKVTALGEKERDRRMSDVRLYLTAMESGLTRQVVVKETEGQGYLIRLNIPQREASEGFGPHVYATLDSLVNQE
ncbi:hypothetical protein KDC22_09465 [Paenibacillus tritici]|uniref:hypothetical protein n=1 Tax=Paenibacillus tritici TaxID=1873425 RepID=UPI001BABC1EB|nr:hypothetical protein [Paenibacillus tritici]QUL56683.1 hypothetical protein KDC22_09465 [Paenibacillus tritici]